MQREGAHADDTITCSADYLQCHLWIGEYLVLQRHIVSGAQRTVVPRIVSIHVLTRMGSTFLVECVSALASACLSADEIEHRSLARNANKLQYVDFAASALAANSFARSSFAAAFPCVPYLPT